MLSIAEPRTRSSANKRDTTKRLITEKGISGHDVYENVHIRSASPDDYAATEFKLEPMPISQSYLITISDWQEALKLDDRLLERMYEQVPQFEHAHFTIDHINKLRRLHRYSTRMPTYSDLLPTMLEVSQHAKEHSWLTAHNPWEAVQRDLMSLQSDWEDTINTPPSEQALRDLDIVISVLPSESSMPDIEIDDETGELTLAWRNIGANQFISIVIPGDGNVMLLAQLAEVIAMRIELQNGGELALLKRLHNPTLSEGLM